ncbi:hypothetical protein BS47DRAFT_1381446 [Hydnum rufescens UP504]|uniref:Uncharacterized protein n=1 Tax=Hydnum rufescens UP504 TaxID=1448309 RepID=A0A9P6DY68_9AGAM|nr:hypothetical protein BS47DRAFT_1381446 [Hydnum rufescens UP504]
MSTASSLNTPSMAGPTPKSLDDTPPHNSAPSQSAPDVGRPGDKFLLVFILVYVLLMPVASALTRPTGYFSLFLDQVYGPRDTQSILMVVGLAAFHTYSFSAVVSVYGQSSHPGGYQVRSPRLVKSQLRGLPHRLVATHEALMDVFPLLGTTAAFVLATHSLAKNTTGSPSVTLIDGLFLYAFVKHILYYIVYLADIPDLRSPLHTFSVSALLSVLYELYRGSA